MKNTILPDELPMMDPEKGFVPVELGWFLHRDPSAPHRIIDLYLRNVYVTTLNGNSYIGRLTYDLQSGSFPLLRIGTDFVAFASIETYREV